jgi:hypothetical protein
MKKILIALKIIQVVSNEQRKKQGLKYIGKGYFNAYRFNPYNPFSYLSVIIILIVGILMFGFYGFWKETDLRNPFKWN